MAIVAINDGSSSAAAGPEARVVSVSLPLLVTQGLHTAAMGAATERAVVPERPVEPVELLQAPRTRDAAAGLRVVGAAAGAAGDAAVRGVDEDGPHDAVHGTGDLEAAANPGDEEDSFTFTIKPLVRCRIPESSNKRGLKFISIITNNCCQNICAGIPTAAAHDAAVHHPAPHDHASTDQTTHRPTHPPTHPSIHSFIRSFVHGTASQTNHARRGARVRKKKNQKGTKASPAQQGGRSGQR